MMEIGTGAAAGLVGATATEILHKENSPLSPTEHFLAQLVDLVGDAYTYFKEQPQKHPDEHKTLQLFPNQNLPLRYNNGNHTFLTLHILVPAAATLTVTIPGLPSFQQVFASAPTAGQLALGLYNRWRFPDNTLLQLTTPSNPTQGYFPIEVLYSDELGD